MSRSRSQLELKLYRYPNNPDFDKLLDENLLDKVRETDRRAREGGLDKLKPKSDPLIPIGMEIDDAGRVTKNGYGVLHLPWLAAEHPEWAAEIEAEVAAVKKAIRDEHGVGLKYVIWAGMGGSAEDKAFYLGAGLLKRRARVFLLDSTDPTKLAAILDQITRLDKQPLEQALKKCLVVGMAMGMTSYEPVVNLEKLDELYRKLGVENRPNFIYMTLPDSILDQFGSKRGFRRIPLQPDGGNSTAGRHSGPMTRGSLYPLALNGVDLAGWMQAAQLSDKEARIGLQLAGFIEGNARAGRDKVTLHLPAQWSAGAVWTKQDFEESLGKSEDIGVKIVIGEKIKLVNYFSPKSDKQDRCFLFVSSPGLRNPDAGKIASLRRAGYPVAHLQVSGDYPVARYMQLIHYTVFGLGRLRDMNFVTQPGVELYKDYARTIYDEARKTGSIEKTKAWKAFEKSPWRLKWIGGLSIDLSGLAKLALVHADDLEVENGNAPAVLAAVLERLRADGAAEYGELTYFGDTRYDEAGKKTLRALDDAADQIFRSRLKMPADVYEGPAMNHSYHEMIIGWGRGVSIVALSEAETTFKRVEYRSDYHRAQWLATQRALTDRKRPVIALTIREPNEAGIQMLREFFAETAKRIKRLRG